MASNGIGTIGIIEPGSKDNTFYQQLVAGPYKTIDVTIGADVDLIATYPGFVCRDIINLHASGDTLKYKEWNDRSTTKTLVIPSAGGRCGLMPVISDLVFASTTALTIKLIMQKIGE